MCVILDTNTFGKFNDPDDEDMEPVRRWLQKGSGKIVYANTENLKLNGGEGE